MNTLFYSFTIGSLLTVVVIFLFYFLIKMKKTQLQQIFSVNMVLLITTCIFIFLQMQLSNLLNVKPIFFANLYYIGIVFFPVSLYFTVKIFVHTKIKFKRRYLLLFIVPLLSLFALWTNEECHLFFKYYDINLNDCKFGPMFIVNEIYSYILYFLSIIELLRFFKKNSGLFAQQLNLFLVGILFPFVLNLLGTLKIIDLTVYITPISSAISIICFTLALFKFQLLDAVPIALTKVVDRMSDGYIVINEKSIITDYNLTLLKMFDIEDKSISSTHIFDLLKLDSFKGLEEKTIINGLKAARESNETLVIEKEFKHIKKYIQIEISNLKTENIFIGALFLFKDFTEHHKDVEIIKSNTNMLIEKERLASLGEMISGVTHNLKTPIFSIAGATEGMADLINEYRTSIDDSSVTVEDHKDIAKDMEEWNNKIKNYTAYMSDIITAIRGQATSFTEDTYETFSIEELMKRVNILMKHELQQALVTLNISYNLTREINLHGNINTLIQILNNLISNAIQSYNGIPNQIIELTLENTESKLIISIKDYGMGISDEVKDKLFKEIITSKGKDGTGLGLFMSYSNIKTQFNGDLKFESELGKGTTFKITLPISSN
ncbi:MAG: GHKL domain-containing protein [Clostridia bacterium]|nr:GHKL domain-containing protein [Clostridia bacterium]